MQKQYNFFTPNGQSVSEFAVAANRKYSHVQKSVAVIGVRKSGKEMCLLKPRKVAEDIRIPPQGRILDWRSDIGREAQRMVLEKAGMMVAVDQFHYLGYGFTNRHHADGSVTENGKLVHWLCAGFGDEPKFGKIYQSDSYAETVEWWHVEGILDQMVEIGMMSERKLYLLESAILEMPTFHKGFKAQVFQELAIAAHA